MAKVTGPLLSFGASGQIAQTQVYATWRGIQYVRRHVVPANPQSTGQTQTRSTFSFLSAIYKQFSADAQAPWKAFATGQKFTDRNAFVHSNLPNLRTATDLTTFIASPSTGGAPSFSGFLASGGVGTVTISADDPVLPTGWSASKFIALALPNTDPHTATAFVSYIDTVAATPFTVALTVPAAAYECFGFYELLNAGGTKVYSASQAGTATAT